MDKELLIDRVISQIEKDIAAQDTAALFELLGRISVDNLTSYLPEGIEPFP